LAALVADLEEQPRLAIIISCFGVAGASDAGDAAGALGPLLVDAGIPALEEALDAAGVTYQVNIYPGVNHAFHNDTGNRYVEAQATQAWQDTLAWFGTYL
ncbi:MAG: dienelactone hydrolase family protein, partial [Anaerolineales bacterium]|nr:dienelactone hydrolase family protein [Anaerolineales bacterium]